MSEIPVRQWFQQSEGEGSEISMSWGANRCGVCEWKAKSVDNPFRKSGIEDEERDKVMPWDGHEIWEDLNINIGNTKICSTIDKKEPVEEES